MCHHSFDIQQVTMLHSIDFYVLLLEPLQILFLPEQNFLKQSENSSIPLEAKSEKEQKSSLRFIAAEKSKPAKIAGSEGIFPLRETEALNLGKIVISDRKSPFWPAVTKSETVFTAQEKAKFIISGWVPEHGSAPEQPLEKTLKSAKAALLQPALLL